MIFNILDNTKELWMTKYIIDEIFSSSRATLYKNLSDQTVGNRATTFIYCTIFITFLAHCVIFLFLFQEKVDGMLLNLYQDPL